MSQACIALVTCPPDAAQTIADHLVAQRLAACVNIVPGLLSVYRWKGQVERDAESLLVIKTDDAHFPALREAVLAVHPYELPEIVQVRIDDGHPPYLSWISESLR